MKLIAAVDQNWAIGKAGGLLCHLPGDLKYFKEKTLGKTVVMGRKTLESLPGGNPLPNRTNVVLTRDTSFQKENCQVVHSIEALLSQYDEEALMVIGGGTVYEALLPYCDTCYITKIEKTFEADTYLPNLDQSPDFILADPGEVREEKGITYRFAIYKRK